MFHMFFLVKYCKALEEGSFRSRSADFLWMLLFGEFASGSRRSEGFRGAFCHQGSLRVLRQV